VAAASVALNSKGESAMAKTGEKCTREGTYDGICEIYRHQDTARFTVGDIFTPCAKCGGQHKPGGAVMNWTWVRS
jgi:hypothetical protein